MIVVMQCAARKHNDAGFLRAEDGRRVCFVADPSMAPRSDCLYAHPDDFSDRGPSWRELLSQYNDIEKSNPLGLLPAYSLYRDDSYARLAEHVGIDKLFILSAGWGLIAGSYLTPYYDITFSMQADAYKRRRKTDTYRDFCMLPDGTEPILFFGSSEYVRLFAALTDNVVAPRALYSRSQATPQFPGIEVISFETTRRTNWQYDCVNAFLNGTLELPRGF
jgi:hypothetical protein